MLAFLPSYRDCQRLQACGLGYVRGWASSQRSASMADMQPLPKSIMPTGLPDLLTDQELRDLLAYLTSRR